jgi:hypothetical protein
MKITTDNATNNSRFINLLADWMQDNNIFFESYNKNFRCFAHIINISIQKALKNLDGVIKQVCVTNLLYFYKWFIIYKINIYFYIVTRNYN